MYGGIDNSADTLKTADIQEKTNYLLAHDWQLTFTETGRITGFYHPKFVIDPQVFNLEAAYNKQLEWEAL